MEDAVVEVAFPSFRLEDMGFGLGCCLLTPAGACTAKVGGAAQQQLPSFRWRDGFRWPAPALPGSLGLYRRQLELSE